MPRSGRNISPATTGIPESPRIFPHFIIPMRIVSAWSSAWCAVRIYFARYFSFTCRKNRYRSSRAICSILFFSVFASHQISIFCISQMIFSLLQIFATSSLSASDSSHRREWSKCTTMSFSFGWCFFIISKSTILSTPPLTAMMRISDGLVYFENVSKKICIIYFYWVFEPKKQSHHLEPRYLGFLFHILCIYAVSYRLYFSCNQSRSVPWVLHNQRHDLQENPYPHGVNRDNVDNDCVRNQ